MPSPNMTIGRDLYAINQNRKATRSIGVIVPHALDPFFAEVVRQIEQSCFQAGYRAVVLFSWRSNVVGRWICFIRCASVVR